MLCFDYFGSTVVHSLLGLIYLVYNTSKYGILNLSIYEVKIGESLGVWFLSKIYFDMWKRESLQTYEII